MGIGLTEFCCSFNETGFFFFTLVLISFNQCYNVCDTRAQPSVSC